MPTSARTPSVGKSPGRGSAPVAMRQLLLARAKLSGHTAETDPAIPWTGEQLRKERPKHTVRSSSDAVPESPRVQVRARTADRRAQITQVALELVAKHGIQGVYLSRIAAAIGISDAALYKHFASKDD